MSQPKDTPPGLSNASQNDLLPGESASSGQSMKFSISLFPADNIRIADITSALAKRGHRISASHAIRLALRAVEINDTRLVTLLEEMKAEDGRARRFANKK